MWNGWKFAGNSGKWLEMVGNVGAWLELKIYELLMQSNAVLYLKYFSPSYLRRQVQILSSKSAEWLYYVVKRRYKNIKREIDELGDSKKVAIGGFENGAAFALKAGCEYPA